MKTILFVFVMLSAGLATADDAALKKQAELEKANAPTTQHQWLKTNLAGSWVTSTKLIMGPGEPKVVAGTAEVKPTHGDRFLVEEATGTMNGKPATRTVWFGYETGRKRFAVSEIDSAGVTISSMSGQLDDATKTLTFTGQIWSQHAGHDVPARLVLKVESDKKHTVEMFSPGPDGKETRRFESVYTRK
jgi:hypothetical protein